MVNLDVFDNLTIFFWAHLDTFRPFQTKINLLPHKEKVGFSGGAFEQKNHFLFEMVRKAPDGPIGVPNGQKNLGGPFRTVLDHFGMLTGLPGMAIFVCFIGAFFWDTL